MGIHFIATESRQSTLVEPPDRLDFKFPTRPLPGGSEPICSYGFLWSRGTRRNICSYLYGECLLQHFVLLAIGVCAIGAGLDWGASGGCNTLNAQLPISYLSMAFQVNSVEFRSWAQVYFVALRFARNNGTLNNQASNMEFRCWAHYLEVRTGYQ